MKSVLLVALGGAVGSVARYKLSGYVLQHAAGWRFPAGTFLVNILGCFVIGALAGLAVKEDFAPDGRLLLFTGLCGGFTTFSAFGLETFYLLRQGHAWLAGAYVVLSVAVSLLALWLGYLAAAQLRA